MAQSLLSTAQEHCTPPPGPKEKRRGEGQGAGGEEKGFPLHFPPKVLGGAEAVGGAPNSWALS